MFKKIAVLALFCLSLGLAGQAKADEAYPKAGPINYLIPFSAGGESDVFARAQQPYLEKELGQKVVVSYKVGAGGAIAWSELANSKPNGYYTVGTNIPHIILQPLQRKDAGYQTHDLKPVMTFHVTPCVLLVHKDSPYKTLKEFLDAAKAKPGSITIGGVGNATAGHIAVVSMLKQAGGIKMPYIPFPGTADLPPALMGKHVQAIMGFTTQATQYKNDMRPLAVAAETRFPGIDAPTFKEEGINLIEGSFRGLAVPKGTPDEIVNTLYQACAKINKIPEFVKKTTDMGMLLMDMGPKDTEKFFDEKIEQYKGILSELQK